VGAQNTKMGLGNFHSSYVHWVGKRENWVFKLLEIISNYENKDSS
jgi:hypothetical protein